MYVGCVVYYAVLRLAALDLKAVAGELSASTKKKLVLQAFDKNVELFSTS